MACISIGDVGAVPCRRCQQSWHHRSRLVVSMLCVSGQKQSSMVKNRDGGGENNNKDVLLEDLASDGPETCMMTKQQAHCFQSSCPATRMIVVADGLPLCCRARATQRRARFTRWQWRPACTHRVVWLFPARCRMFVFHSEETRESWLLKSESICFPFSSTAAIPISAFIKRRSDGS